MESLDLSIDTKKPKKFEKQEKNLGILGEKIRNVGVLGSLSRKN